MSLYEKISSTYGLIESICVVLNLIIAGYVFLKGKKVKKISDEINKRNENIINYQNSSDLATSLEKLKQIKNNLSDLKQLEFRNELSKDKILSKYLTNAHVISEIKTIIPPKYMEINKSLSVIYDILFYCNTNKCTLADPNIKRGEPDYRSINSDIDDIINSIRKIKADLFNNHLNNIN